MRSREQTHISSTGFVGTSQRDSLAQQVSRTEEWMHRRGGLGGSEDDDGSSYQRRHGEGEESVGEMEGRERIGVLYQASAQS
jgi:hypothetical protein